MNLIISSGAVRDWLAGCEARKRSPVFRFAEDETGTEGGHGSPGNVGEDVRGCITGRCPDRKDEGPIDRCISGAAVRRATGKIYAAGGCGSGDGYAKGYDDGVTAALGILLREAGYCPEDVLDKEGHCILKKQEELSFEEVVRNETERTAGEGDMGKYGIASELH